VTVLVCDLGGTNCRLALADPALDRASVLRLANDGFAAFPALLGEYLRRKGRDRVRRVVVALAAPVSGDRVRLTNRDWHIDKAEVAAATGASEVSFINDFEALGHALERPDILRHAPLQSPRAPLANAPRLVLGAGTGFNCALWHPGGVVCCEAGHTGFAAETAFDRALADHLAARHGRCSTERVLSGSGILEIYRVACALAGQGPGLSAGRDVVRAGLDGSDPAAATACREFARILGRTAGDLALLFLARGGVFLSGGATRAVAPLLSGPGNPFLAAFSAKGRMTASMAEYPVHLLGDDDAALHGCVNWAKRSAIARQS
jgi:glucokinase